MRGWWTNWRRWGNCTSADRPNTILIRRDRIPGYFEAWLTCTMARVMTCGKRCQSAISIAVTAAALSVLVLWVTSHCFSYAIGAYRERRMPNGVEYTFIGLHSDTGQVGVGRNWRRYTWIPPSIDATESMGGWEWMVEASAPGMNRRFAWTGNALTGFVAGAGFNVSNIDVSRPNESERKHAVLVPWWAVFLVTCAVAVKWLFFRERQLHWGKVGRCVACGYDLRESSERCPECGEQIPDGAAAPSKAAELR